MWLRLDEADGFRPAFNPGSFFADTDGSVWAGAGSEIFHYTPPADLVSPAFAPQVFISAWSWDNQRPRLVDGVESIPYGVKAAAHLGTLQYDRRNGLRIRYRLSPGSNWTETGSLDIPLGEPGSGNHTLEVQARIFTGPWSAAIRSNFIVPVPGWRTIPLLLAYLATSLLIAGAIFARHRHRQAEEAELLPDMSRARFRALLPEAEQVEGTVLDARFEVSELIARSGFASVMQGFDRQTGRRCAVKVFRAELTQKEWMRRRFEQEVESLTRVRHRNVVSIYAHGHTPSGTPYLVMEFVGGRVLRRILEAGPLGPQRTAGILAQLAEALDAIHAAGIWHRDVKPENIIVRDDNGLEQALLIDFSIAIVKDADESLHGVSRAAGSFHYMAPEQAIGYATSASDVYSLARVTIEMLTGKMLKDLLPDAALDLPVRIPPMLQAIGCGLSAEAIGLLASAQEFDPARRPSEAGAFAAPIVRDLLRAVSSAEVR